ncbi:MAG: RNA polymerase sigma factor [Armatimonadetes bacterium]|nr:RNA polymerase sigma factor [Armatimonadota bacterium]
MDNDENDLIKYILNGQSELFDCIIEKHYHYVLSFVYSRTRNLSAAEDITQETFIKAFLKLHQLKVPGYLLKWLLSIAANECKMWQRQRKDVPFCFDECRLSIMLEEWHQEEAKIDVAEAVNSLSEQNKSVVLLHYIYGFSCGEISRLLHIPVTTVEKRLYHSRRQMKTHLDGYQGNNNQYEIYYC